MLDSFLQGLIKKADVQFAHEENICNQFICIDCKNNRLTSGVSALIRMLVAREQSLAEGRRQ